MTYKDPVKQKQAQRAYYERNREAVLAKNRENKEKRKQIVRDAKSCPCQKCGKSYPPKVMDLHHREGEQKDGKISRMVERASLAALIEEIAKCDVLCANCHRMEH